MRDRSRHRDVRWWLLALLTLWGLTPLLWFRGKLLWTEDLRLPPTLHHWSYTWQGWHPGVGTGVESTFDASLIVFHGIPAVLKAISGSALFAQQVTFVWWFMFAVFGIYLLASRVTRGDVVASLVATSCYVFNPWLDHIWLSFKPPLVSGYAVIPFMLVLILDVVDGRRSLKATLGWVTALSVVGSGMGSNPSETLAVVCPLVLLAGAVLLRHVLRGESRQLWHVGRCLLAIAATAVCASAFWILPEAMAIVSQARQTGLVDYAQMSRQWLSDISTYTNFFSVLRFYGDWTWHGGHAGDPYRTYSSLYLTHPLFLALSWVIPGIALLGLLRGQWRYRLFLVSLTGFGLLLSMGVHPPTGVCYQWLVNHLPYFWIVRSPYFKFMFLTCLGYALAIGLAYQVLKQWIEPRTLFRHTGPILGAGLIAIHMVYASPFVLGKMFVLPEGRKGALPPNHLEIPRYVTEAAAWLNAQPDFFRIYHLPAKDSPRRASWGYDGAFPILMDFSTHPELFSYRPPFLLFAQGATNEAEPLTKLLATSLHHETTDRMAHFLRLLGIRYVLHETDILPNRDPPPGQPLYDAPAFIRGILARQRGIAPARTFGPWEFWEVNTPMPHVYHVPVATLIVGDARAILPLTQGELLAAPALVMTADTPWPIIQQLLAAQAFDALVVAVDAPLPGPLPATLPVTLVASTDQWTRQVDPAQATPLMPTATGFGPPERLPSGAVRFPLVSNSATNWTLTNPTAGPQTVQLQGTVTSPQQPRSLFAYLDQQLLAITPIPAGTPTPAILSATLSPGTHTVGWYSPDARTVLSDGRQVGFYFADDWRVGPPIYQATLQVPQTGRYTVWVRPGIPRDDEVLTPTLRLGEVAIPLVLDPKTPGVKRATVSLPAGPNSLIISGTGGIPYTLIFTLVDRPPSASKSLTSLTPSRAAPTSYTIPPPPGRGWVVFNESYNARWILQSPATPTAAVHVKINGFANGYYLGSPPKTPVALTFTAQRWIIVGSAISCLTVCSVAAGCLWGWWRS